MPQWHPEKNSSWDNKLSMKSNNLVLLLVTVFLSMAELDLLPSKEDQDLLTIHSTVLLVLEINIKLDPLTLLVLPNTPQDHPE